MADHQQSLRQASIRAVTGTTHTYEGDWHALWDSLSTPGTTFNERMLNYINTSLSASYTEINSAMAALAAENSATTFQAMGTFTPGGDETAPTLSNATDTATGETTADVGVDTDEANGTLYVVVTTSSTSPTAAQVKLGQDNSAAAAAYASSQAVSSTGTKAFSATGLTASTAYTAHFMHEDAASNQSTVVKGNGFTTDSGAFDPLSAFSSGEDGFIFDPSNLASLDQAVTASTTPVTTDADPVGYIADLTGNGHHAAATAADTTRALYKTAGGLHWLESDGTNDKYRITPGTLLNNKAGCTIIFAGRGTTGGDRSLILIGKGDNAAFARAFFGKDSSDNIRGGGRRLDADSAVTITGTGDLNATDKVGQADLIYSSSDLNLYINGTLDTASTSFQTDGNTSATNSLGIGFLDNNAAAQFWLGRVYWFMVIDRVLDSTERAAYTTYAGAKAGLTL